VKAPPSCTVAVTVGVHCQSVWWPERSTSIVLPASPGAEPVNVSVWRSIAVATACTVIPFPVALTNVLPGSVVIGAANGEPAVGFDAFVLCVDALRALRAL
jgi:hypothetical protein